MEQDIRRNQMSEDSKVGDSRFALGSLICPVR